MTLIEGPTATTNVGSIRRRVDIAGGPKCTLKLPKIRIVKGRRKKKGNARS